MKAVRMTTLLQLCALFIAGFCFLRSAEGAPMGAPADDHLHFRRLTPKDGLPSAVVYCIFEDSRGFLWFGTADGLARYDSHQFRSFRPDPNDPHSLANGSVLAIQEDAQGNLWIATEGGLDLWHRDTERFSHFRHDPADPASLSDDTTQSLLLDEDGSLWVGTTRGGLNHFDPRSGKCERYEAQPGRNGSLSDSWVRCLFRDRQGFLWIGTGNGGLNLLDPQTGHFRVYAHDPNNPRSLSHDRVSAIAEDDEGYLWVCTDQGISRLDPERQFFERFPVNADDPGALHYRTVAAVAVGNDGRIWVGTDGGGVSRYDPATRRFTHHRYLKYADNTLMSDAVRAIFQDRRGDFWIGHFPAGVSHVDQLAAPFHVFRSVPGETNTLSDEQVLSFLEDPSGDLWVGTDNGGLNHWSAAAGRWTSYRHDPRDPRSLGGKAALTVLRDHRGQLWVGSWDGGLNRFEPGTGTFRRYLPEPGRTNSLSDADAWRLVEDHQRQLWVATIRGGVERYVPDEDGFVHHRHDPADPRSLNDDIACALLVTRDGTLWVGTPKGLARWVPATQDWDRFQSQPGQPGTLNNYWIFDLLEDRAGMIWATTEGGGLNRLDPRTGACENFRTADGLPSDILRGILEDDDGMLWIGSNRGLARFDPRTRQVRIFDESNGLPGSQFNPHARLRLRSGEFLFGTTQGFVRFDPRALKPNPHPPPVVLTDFEVFNETVLPGLPDSALRQSITETRRLEIPARLSVLGFQFAGLSYRSPEHTQYRFKLEGFDHDWRKPGPERRATFTNLDPGRYVLRVKAANSDGVWNEAGVSLELIIVPPWWGSWWFRSTAALALLGGSLTVGWAISARRLREAQREQQIARERERAQERERAAEAVRHSEQELQLILNSIPAMVWYKDTQNHVLAVNQAAALLEGREADQIRGRSCQELYPPELADANYRDDLEVVRSGKPKLGVQEHHVTTGSNTECWLEMSRVPVFDQEGVVTSIIVFAIDITERKRAEETIRELNQQLEQRVAERTAQLEVANKELESFSYSVSHDLRAPLRRVDGFSRALLEDYENLLDLEGKESLHRIRAATQRMGHLIDDLLNLARISRSELHVTPVDLSALAYTVAEALRETDPKQPMDFIIAPNLTANGDLGLLRIVLENLFSNAVKFSSTRPVARVEFGLTERDGEPVYFVRDNGVGFDTAYAHKLFGAFQRLHTVAEFPGTGIGLATVQRIIRRHGGRVGAESQPDRGATFYFTIPDQTLKAPGKINSSAF